MISDFRRPKAFNSSDENIFRRVPFDPNAVRDEIPRGAFNTCECSLVRQKFLLDNKDALVDDINGGYYNDFKLLFTTVGTIKKEFSTKFTPDNKRYYKQELIHEPTPCNYPHSVFRLFENDNPVLHMDRPKSIKKKIQSRYESIFEYL